MSDGVIRRFPYQIDGLETFPFVAAERALGHPIDPASLPDKRVWIDFSGPPGAIPFLSFSRVLTGKFDPTVVRGAIVVVGVTAPTVAGRAPDLDLGRKRDVGRGDPGECDPHRASRLPAPQRAVVAEPARDLHPRVAAAVPRASLLGGVDDRARDSARRRLRGRRRSTRSTSGTILAFVYPVGALVISTVGALGAHYVFAAFDRQRTRDTFARFVPEEVVNQVLAQTHGELRLGGVRVVGTCMFVDLRGSTQFAESLPPETVVHVINRYLSELTEAILGHGGTLISYLGDGFMAVFGAPIEQEDHADRALSAAREIIAERLPRFNEWLREQGYGDSFVIGIGINTRPVHGGKRRLREAARVHGDGRHDQHRLAARGVDEGLRLLPADGGLDARGGRRHGRRLRRGRRGRGPRPPGQDQGLVDRGCAEIPGLGPVDGLEWAVRRLMSSPRQVPCPRAGGQDQGGVQ